MLINRENILVLADIHGNLEALDAVLKKAEEFGENRILILGDIIDYGPRSNEVIAKLKKYEKQIILGIWGNHEQAILEEKYERFSSMRGVCSAQYTRRMLTDESKQFLNKLNHTGKQECKIGEKLCLAIHGSLDDVFWRSIAPNSLNGNYARYDVVFSGHSHIPHYFEMFYNYDNPDFRNKKRTVFVNPGSVGQPRNHSPRAAFAIIEGEFENIHMLSVPYNIKEEQKLYSDEVDEFYKERIEKGI